MKFKGNSMRMFKIKLVQNSTGKAVTSERNFEDTKLLLTALTQDYLKAVEILEKVERKGVVEEQLLNPSLEPFTLTISYTDSGV